MDALKTTIVGHLAAARAALLDAAPHIDAVRQLGLQADGDHSDLVFAAIEDIESPHSPLKAWIDRADQFIARCALEEQQELEAADRAKAEAEQAKAAAAAEAAKPPAETPKAAIAAEPEPEHDAPAEG